MNRRTILWTTGSFTALILALSAVVLLAARDTSLDHLIEQGRELADIRSSTDEGVALYVDGQSVPTSRFLELRARTEHSKQETNSILERVVPNHDPDLQYSSFEFRDPSAKIPESMASTWRDNKKLFDQHDIDAIVLAGVIPEYAQYALALEAGYTMSQDEIDAEAARYKAGYEIQKEHGGSETLYPDPETGEMVMTNILKDVQWIAYVDSLGDKYWEEIFPEQARREGITAKWRMATLQGIDDLNEIDRIIREQYKNALLNATVRITGELDIEATLDDAVKYQEHWERSHQQQPDNPPIAVPK